MKENKRKGRILLIYSYQSIEIERHQMKRMDSLNKMTKNTSHERKQTKRMNSLNKMRKKTLHLKENKRKE